VLPTRIALKDGSSVMMSGSGYVTGLAKSRGGFETTLGGSGFAAPLRTGTSGCQGSHTSCAADSH
jgi:hypothetical protein